MLEIVRWYFLQDHRGDLHVHDFTIVSVFSPLGLLLSAWETPPNSWYPAVGLLFQTGLAALLWRAAARYARRGLSADSATASPPLSAPS